MSKSSSSNAFRPLHDKIVVRREKAEDKTAAGIFLPEKAKETPKIGTVEAVGTGTLNHETGALIPLTVKKGDKVLFSSYAGTEIKLDGKELLVMSEDEVLAILD